MSYRYYQSGNPKIANLRLRALIKVVADQVIEPREKDSRGSMGIYAIAVDSFFKPSKSIKKGSHSATSFTILL
jgi:hypothetical protein